MIYKITYGYVNGANFEVVYGLPDITILDVELATGLSEEEVDSIKLTVLARVPVVVNRSSGVVSKSSLQYYIYMCDISNRNNYTLDLFMNATREFIRNNNLNNILNE